MKRRRYSAHLNEIVETPQGAKRLHLALLDPQYRARLVLPPRPMPAPDGFKPSKLVRQ
jgi:hypothetical protein